MTQHSDAPLAAQDSTYRLMKAFYEKLETLCAHHPDKHIFYTTPKLIYDEEFSEWRYTSYVSLSLEDLSKEKEGLCEEG